MKANPRAAIAYVAGTIIGSKQNSSIYDFNRNRHVMINGTCTAKDVSIYDHEENCHITGSGNNGGYGLYHFGNSKHINLTVRGENFEGYHFSGTVNGGSVALYDFETNSYFNYSL